MPNGKETNNKSMIINPPNFYWIQEEIPTEIYTYLLSQIAKAKFDHKHQLAGHISKSLVLPDEEKIFTRYLLNKSQNLEWAQVTGNHVDLWVNFQKKHEFKKLIWNLRGSLGGTSGIKSSRTKRRICSGIEPQHRHLSLIHI